MVVVDGGSEPLLRLPPIWVRPANSTPSTRRPTKPAVAGVDSRPRHGRWPSPPPSPSHGPPPASRRACPWWPSWTPSADEPSCRCGVGRAARATAPSPTPVRTLGHEALHVTGRGGTIVDELAVAQGDAALARSTNSSWWVATTTVAPSSAASSSSSTRAALPGWSSPTNGSSTTSTSNGRTSPRASDVFWRRPAAEAARQVVGAVGDAEAVEQVCGPLLPALGLVQAGHVLDVLGRGSGRRTRRGRRGGRRGRPARRSTRRGRRRSSTLPSDGSSSPASIADSVVFPDPLVPTRTTRSPCSIVRSSGANATRSP